LPKQDVEAIQTNVRESLKLVDEDLKAMPDDHEVFRRPDVFPRAEWMRWSETMQKNLLGPAKTETPLPFIR
jgi:hypothetical protein